MGKNSIHVMKLRCNKENLLDTLNRKYTISEWRNQLAPESVEMPSSVRRRNSVIKHQSRMRFRSPKNQWKVKLSNVILNKIHTKKPNLNVMKLTRRGSVPLINLISESSL